VWKCIPTFHSLQSARTDRWYSEYTWLKAGRISFRPPQKVKKYNCSYMPRATPWRRMGERRKSSVHFFLSRQIFTFLPTHPDRSILLLTTVDADCSFTRSRATRLWNRALAWTNFPNYNAVNMFVEVRRSGIVQCLHRA